MILYQTGKPGAVCVTLLCMMHGARAVVGAALQCKITEQYYRTIPNQ